MYNLEEFIRYIGNPLDNTVTNNVMCFVNGRCIFVSVSHQSDIERAEKFIARKDGQEQIYVNVNPAAYGTKGKPKDVDIPAIKTLYLDIDAPKEDGARRNPATPYEMSKVPMKDIYNTVRRKYANARVDITGNGWRILIPVKDAMPGDERKLVMYMNNLFPEFVDRAVSDPSRVTGVPGTMNVKIATDDRPNHRRAGFSPYTMRHESRVADYAAEEVRATRTQAPPSMDVPKIESVAPGSPATPVSPEPETQKLLNKYIIEISRSAPHILKILLSEPNRSAGFAFDSFIACEIYNKIGDEPRVFATICKLHWQSDYDSHATRAVWERTVSEKIGVWSNSTIRRTFGGI